MVNRFVNAIDDVICRRATLFETQKLLGRGQMKKLLVLILALLFLGDYSGAERKKPIRISAWYWLNAAPKTDWEGDFVTMKNNGFNSVLLCWGIDLTAVNRRASETKQAMRWAHNAGLDVYLIIWHPYGNLLEKKPEYMQVDSEGRVLPTFDVFNPEWRNSEWKTYLETVARLYKDAPGMKGYVFDDSFGAGGTGVVSYGAYEKKTFGEPLPKKPGDPRWDEWVKVRTEWWTDWAKDTVRYIRTGDPNKSHIIYVEDGLGSIVDANRPNNIGLDFSKVAPYFDAVGGYTMSSWTSSPDSGQQVADRTSSSIKRVRNLVGPEEQIIYTFWSANPKEEGKTGPAEYPTAEQIKLVCEAALKLGVRHLDMYGYRIGNPNVKQEDWLKWLPAEPAPYRLTGQFPAKFMWDRPEIHDELSQYLKSLTKQNK